jgi:DNA-binding PadR family transcriptional regulator
MDESHQIWPLALEVLRALGQHYYPVMESRAVEAGMGESDWSLLLAVLTFDPEPVSAAKLRVRVPFYAPFVYENRLKKLADTDYLKASSPADDGSAYPHFEYNLTESGRMTIQWIIQAADAAMSSLRPMPLEALEQLAHLLERVVLAAVESPPPPPKWALTHSRTTDHARVAPVMVRIDQYLSDLRAWRDDCHLCSWQQHLETFEISPPAWETSNYLWRVAQQNPDGGYTLDELTHLLERRGHPRHVYANALKELNKRGWVTLEKKVYRLTADGHRMRQESEARTNQYFYAPFNVLDANELFLLKDLIVELWDGMQARITANQA